MIVHFTLKTYTPLLVSPVVVYPYMGNPSYPDVEFYVENYSSIDPDLHMAWKALADANSNGEDNISGTFQFSAPLPIMFKQFTALFVDDAVQLRWEMDDNLTSGSFDIERSLDGINFEKIHSLSGGDKKAYSYFDTQYKSGKQFYRIKQKDLDGKFVYSNVVNITIEEAYELYLVPNPSKGFVSVQGLDAEKYSYKVISITGQAHTLPITVKHNAVLFQTESLGKGLYYLIATSDSDKQIMKLMVD